MRRVLDSLLPLAGPAGLIALFAVIASQTVNAADDVKFRTAIVNVAIVVALYVFVGNSGVVSFGQVSFVAVGAFSAGLLTVPSDVKPGVLPDLFPLFKDHSISNPWSLVLAAALGGVFALVAGVPLMRLSGLAAGIATFAVLGITYNILTYWTRIGPGATTLTLIPVTTDYLQATVGTLAVLAIAFAYQRSRWGRQLRATREDPAAAQAAGIDVHRQRLGAFVLSGTLSGFAGGLYVHLPPGSITTNQVYLDLTFLTLAMLVVGGVHSLWGAVLGALGVSLVNILLQNGENGIHLGGWKISLPQGSSLVGVSLVMLAVLLLRPGGITGGREFTLPRSLRGRAGSAGAEPPAPAPEAGV
ncbi:MAG TPA: branched-chain amino acid ABC transporter permease [Gaiellaceae bacterium]|nr:branched-chain amino acid ABC transporter permease [Gaiellaceae bacterium]